MPLYEHIFLARQDVTSQQVETMVDQYKGVIESNGGKVEKTEMWGVKSLAYRITYGKRPRKRARLIAVASSRCFFAETAVIRDGTILPRSET